MANKRFGDFEILSKLGAGAQGEVFLATGPTGEKVALKLLHAQFGRDKDVSGRFKREARIAMSVDHPNVVRALDAGEEKGRLYMACEFVEGGGLDGLIAREGRLPEAKALQIFRGLLSGLDAIHKAGLIHRDVKPANVLLDSKGTARLSDLGLARSTSADRTRYTATGMLVGSPAFMAPEQVEPSGELDIRCDLYSAGIVLFQCLSGQLPFRGATVLDTLRAQVETPPPPLDSVEPAVKPEISRLVLDLMQKNPEDRPPTPAAVLARLDALAGPPAAPEGEKPFAATLDSEAGFPGTIDAPERPAPAEAPVPFFPMTLDVPEGEGFAVTLGVVEAAKQAPPVSRIELLPSAAGSKAALSRVKLTAAGAEGTRTLFVYAGSRLQVGRDGLDRCDSEVCLRLRPSRGNEDAIRRISGRHFKIEVEGNRALLRDLGSTCGTVVDGAAVSPEEPRPLGPLSRIRAAGVIEVEAAVIPPPPPPAPAVKGRGEAQAAPAVFVSRPENGREHAYALVPGRLPLSAGPAAGWLGSEGGDLELFTVLGGLWARGGGLPAGEAAALGPGLRLKAGGVELEVSGIAPADQK